MESKKSDKGPDITEKDDVIDVDEGEANAEPGDFEDPAAVTVGAEIVAVRQLKKMTLNNTWSHSEVTNLERRGSVLVLTTPFLSTVQGSQHVEIMSRGYHERSPYLAYFLRCTRTIELS